MKLEGGRLAANPNSVRPLLERFLAEVDSEESYLGILAGNAESFMFAKRIKESHEWGADAKWRDVMNGIVDDLHKIFRQKRLWVKDLQQKWSDPNITPMAAGYLTLIYAKKLQEVAKKLFSVLHLLSKKSFSSYSTFKQEIMDPIRVVLLSMNEDWENSARSLAMRKAS
jgi:hypothetical protein